MSSSQIKKTRNWLALVLTGLLAIACGDDPLSSGSGGTTSIVRFDLGDRTLSSGLKICSEGDSVSLLTRQEGGVSPQQKDPDSTCGATFQVKVKKGKRVDFTGEIAGNGRPLLRGTDTLLAEQAVDGFRVDISLSEVPALRVTTQTLGFGGPETYYFRVGPDGEPVPIGPNTTDTVGAIAAGPERRVTLDAAPCFVNQDTVTIPVPEEQLADAVFRDIDCTLPGNLFLEIRTGVCPVTSYTLRLVQTDPAASPYTETRTTGQNVDETFTDIPPGNYRVELVTGFGTATPVQDVFLPTGGSATVVFNIDCPTGTLEINTVTTGPQQPTSYEFKVDVGPSGPIAANTKENPVSVVVTAGDRTVELTGIPDNCSFPSPADSLMSVTVPAGGIASVTFTVNCRPIVTQGSIRLITETLGSGAAAANPYPFEITDADGTLVGSGTVALNASTLLSPFNTQKNPHRVEFFHGTCVPHGPQGNPVQFVTVPTNGEVVAEFWATCDEGQSPP